MTILSSDHGRIMSSNRFSLWRKQFRDFSLKSWRKDFVASAVESEGRRVRSVLMLRTLYWMFHICDAQRINHEIHFAGRRNIW